MCIISKVKSPLHRTNGGTAITNFEAKQKDLYEKAIKEYGDNDLYVSSEIMSPEFNSSESMLCLHEKKGSRDLSDFWQIFRRLEKKINNTSRQRPKRVNSNTESC